MKSGGGKMVQEKTKCVLCERETTEDNADFIPHIGKLEEGTGVVLQVPICKDCQSKHKIVTTKLNNKGLMDICVPEDTYNLLEKLDEEGKLG